MLSYFYDDTTFIFQLWNDDKLIIELPYADKMNQEDAEKLAQELWEQYCDANNLSRKGNNV